jgi:hypothetical protein
LICNPLFHNQREAEQRYAYTVTDIDQRHYVNRMLAHRDIPDRDVDAEAPGILSACIDNRLLELRGNSVENGVTAVKCIAEQLKLMGEGCSTVGVQLRASCGNLGFASLLSIFPAEKMAVPSTFRVSTDFPLLPTDRS